MVKQSEIPHFERLALYMGFIKKSRLEFAKEANLNPSSLSKYLNGNTKNPGIDFAEAIIRAFPDLNANWWFTGNGNMIKGEELASGFVAVEQKDMDKMEADLKKYMEAAYETVVKENDLLRENRELKEKLAQYET